MESGSLELELGTTYVDSDVRVMEEEWTDSVELLEYDRECRTYRVVEPSAPSTAVGWVVRSLPIEDDATRPPSLYDLIDPDALDCLVSGRSSPPASNLRVTFTYATHEVTVAHNGVITTRPLRRCSRAGELPRPDGRPLSLIVVRAVAEERGVSPSSLVHPLYAAVDPDCLDSVFRSTTGHVAFEYDEELVTVESDGTVRLTGRSEG